MRSIVFSLSAARCTSCEGSGYLVTKFCHCVARKAFNDGLRCEIDYTRGPSRSHRNKSWGYPEIEKRADVFNCARRVLTPVQLEIFLLRFGCGIRWRRSAELTDQLRGEHFHEIYRIQVVVGRALLTDRFKEHTSETGTDRGPEAWPGRRDRRTRSRIVPVLAQTAAFGSAA